MAWRGLYEKQWEKIRPYLSKPKARPQREQPRVEERHCFEGIYGRCGNLKPSFTFFYDWSGPWLIQPGVDWTFWDPFRASVRYNYLDGRGNRGLGISNNKDTVWVELQYLLY